MDERNSVRQKMIGGLVVMVLLAVLGPLQAGEKTAVEESQAILESIQQAVSDDQIPEPLEFWARRRVAEILTRNGQVGSSLETVRVGSDSGTRNRVLRKVVTITLEGENPPLRDLLELLREEETRVVADLLIRTAVQIDRRSLARRLAVRYSTPKRCLHDSLAEAYLQQGLIDELGDFLPKVKPVPCRGRARVILAREYARKGEQSRAERQFTRAREELSGTPEDLAVLAYRQSQAGYRARAKITFHDAYRRAKEVLHDTGAVQADRAFAAIVDYQLRADLPETTWSSIWMRGADSEAVRQTQFRLVRYWARKSQLDQALSVVNSLQSIGESEPGRLILARELLARGDTKTAKQVGNGLKSPELRRELQFSLLKHRACSGQGNAAEADPSTFPGSSEFYYRSWFWIGRCQPSKRNPPCVSTGNRSGRAAAADSFYRLGVLSSTGNSPGALGESMTKPDIVPVKSLKNQ